MARSLVRFHFSPFLLSSLIRELIYGINYFHMSEEFAECKVEDLNGSALRVFEKAKWRPGPLIQGIKLELARRDWEMHQGRRNKGFSAGVAVCGNGSGME